MRYQITLSLFIAITFVFQSIPYTARSAVTPRTDTSALAPQYMTNTATAAYQAVLGPELAECTSEETGLIRLTSQLLRDGQTGYELLENLINIQAQQQEYKDYSFVIGTDNAVYIVSTPSETAPFRVVRVSSNLRPAKTEPAAAIFPNYGTEYTNVFVSLIEIPAQDMEGIRQTLRVIDEQTSVWEENVHSSLTLSHKLSHLTPVTARTAFIGRQKAAFEASLQPKKPVVPKQGFDISKANAAIKSLARANRVDFYGSTTDFAAALQQSNITYDDDINALFTYYHMLLEYELSLEIANEKAGPEHITNPTQTNRYAHLHTMFLHNPDGTVQKDKNGNYAVRTDAFNLVIDQNDVKWWRLEKWGNDFRKASPKATAGVRDSTNVVYPWDTRYPKHVLGDMLTALAQLQMIRDRMGHGIQPIATVAGEARWNTRMIEGLVSRVFAGNGADVHTTPVGKKIPIWMDSFIMTTFGYHLGQFNTSSHSARNIACFKILKGLMQGTFWRNVIAKLRGQAVNEEDITGMSPVQRIVEGIENPGSQLLIEEMVEIADRVETFIVQAKDSEFVLHVAAADSPMIHRSIDSGKEGQIPATDLYIAYLKELYPPEVFEVIKEAEQNGLRIGYHLLHGSMAEKLPEIYDRLGISGVFEYIGRTVDEWGYYGGIGVADFAQKPTQALIADRKKTKRYLEETLGDDFFQRFSEKPFGYSEEGVLTIDGKTKRIKFKVESKDPETDIVLAKFALLTFDIGNNRQVAFYEPVYTDLSQDLSVLEVVKEAGLREQLGGKEAGYPELTTDPDGDRQVVLQILVNTPEIHEFLTKNGIGYTVLDDDSLAAVFSPNQSFFLTMVYEKQVLSERKVFTDIIPGDEIQQWLKERYPGAPDNLRDWSAWHDFDWYMIPTTASTPVWTEWAGKQKTRRGTGIPCTQVPVGFKEIASIQQKVEPQIQANMARLRKGLPQKLHEAGIAANLIDDITVFAASMPGTSGLITYLLEKGLSSEQVTAVLKGTNTLTKDVIIIDVFGVFSDRGEVINLGKNPRLLFGGEESGGMLFGSTELQTIKIPMDEIANWTEQEAFLKSAGITYRVSSIDIHVNGRVEKKDFLILDVGIVSPREKSAGEASVAMAAFIARQYKEKEFTLPVLAETFSSILEENNIVYRCDYRNDESLYDPSQPREIVAQQKKAGERWRDENNAFFRQLALLYQMGYIRDISMVEDIIRACIDTTMQEGYGESMARLQDIRFVGDGTWLQFEDCIVEIRPSGTDAKIKGYGGGLSRNKAMAYANAVTKVFYSVIQGTVSHDEFPQSIAPEKADKETLNHLLDGIQWNVVPEDLHINYGDTQTYDDVVRFLLWTEELYMDYLNSTNTYYWLLDLAETPADIAYLFEKSKFARRSEQKEFIRRATERFTELYFATPTEADVLGALAALLTDIEKDISKETDTRVADRKREAVSAWRDWFSKELAEETILRSV